MGSIAEKYADRIIVTDDNPRFEDPQQIVTEIVAGIKKSQRFMIELNRKKAIARAAQLSKKNSTIAILGKGHERYYMAQGKKLHFDDFKEIIKY